MESWRKSAGLSGPPYADTDKSLSYIQLCDYVPTFNGSNLNARIDKITSLHPKNAECEEGFLAHMGIFCSESRSDAFVKGLQSTISGDNLFISHLHLTGSPLSVLTSSAISALAFSSPLHLCSSSTRARRPLFTRWISRTTLCRPKTHGSLRASSTNCPVCSQ